MPKPVLRIGEQAHLQGSCVMISQSNCYSRWSSRSCCRRQSRWSPGAPPAVPVAQVRAWKSRLAELSRQLKSAIARVRVLGRSSDRWWRTCGNARSYSVFRTADPRRWSRSAAMTPPVRWSPPEKPSHHSARLSAVWGMQGSICTRAMSVRRHCEDLA